jgi:hypothetical protein
VKRLTPYQKRQRAGKRDWTKFQKYRVHYYHLEVLFSGLTFFGGFLLVAGFLRGYHTPLDFVAVYSLTAFTGIMFTIREYFVIKSSWRYWRLVVN